MPPTEKPKVLKLSDLEPRFVKQFFFQQDRSTKIAKEQFGNLRSITNCNETLILQLLIPNRSDKPNTEFEKSFTSSPDYFVYNGTHGFQLQIANNRKLFVESPKEIPQLLYTGLIKLANSIVENTINSKVKYRVENNQLYCSPSSNMQTLIEYLSADHRAMNIIHKQILWQFQKKYLPSNNFEAVATDQLSKLDKEQRFFLAALGLSYSDIKNVVATSS